MWKFTRSGSNSEGVIGGCRPRMTQFEWVGGYERKARKEGKALGGEICSGSVLCTMPAGAELHTKDTQDNEIQLLRDPLW